MEVMWRMVLTISALCWGLCSSDITCKDKNGGQVDWYILYKAPKLKDKQLSGLEYFYIDSTTTQWFDGIDDPKSVLSNTLKPLLDYKTPSSNFGFITYNDQPPRYMLNIASTYGHSKGVVMMNKTTGVWLLHSTPQFPYNRKHGTLWPKSGTQRGQTFICVTFDYSTFNPIGNHLWHIRAYPFDYSIPEGFHSVLQSVVKREDPKPNNPFLDQDLTSRGGQKFKSFAKYSSKGKAQDLYFHIAKELNSNLSVKTWRRIGNQTKPACSVEGKFINTIVTVAMTGPVKRKRKWTDCNDHSKWCIPEDQNREWTCIADLNREKSQDERPGGALCIERLNVKQEFTRFIDQKIDCPGTLPPCPPTSSSEIPVFPDLSAFILLLNLLISIIF